MPLLSITYWYLCVLNMKLPKVVVVMHFSENPLIDTMQKILSQLDGCATFCFKKLVFS